MGTATYVFARQHGGRSHFAKVAVSAECGVGRSVQVSSAAFAWLKDEYGPDAYEWSVCDEYRASAVAGAEQALQHIADRDGTCKVRVVIDRIHAHPAHSSPADVEYATTLAVWQALGVQGIQVSTPLDS